MDLFSGGRSTNLDGLVDGKRIDSTGDMSGTDLRVPNGVTKRREYETPIAYRTTPPF